MCSSRSVFPVNFVNVGSFIPTGIAAFRISGEKDTRHANSVLVTRRACPASFAERTAIYCHNQIHRPPSGPVPLPRVPEPHDGYAIQLRAHYSS
ncbi:hypothetical protein LIER_41446 [Lithospermum erythrorhizon]|uniref:Uncharacterized protein n=1 Tax=Lithospermum erythrorhizon TaxID=34254 RepID=A0AAV3RDH1_LITER